MANNVRPPPYPTSAEVGAAARYATAYLRELPGVWKRQASAWQDLPLAYLWAVMPAYAGAQTPHPVLGAALGVALGLLPAAVAKATVNPEFSRELDQRIAARLTDQMDPPKAEHG
jgi:hypothetical protein